MERVPVSGYNYRVRVRTDWGDTAWEDWTFRSWDDADQAAGLLADEIRDAYGFGNSYTQDDLVEVYNVEDEGIPLPGFDDFYHPHG